MVVFFQPATKLKTRYSTLGFSEEARLDDGAMWPTSWALTSLDVVELDAITDLVKRATADRTRVLAPDQIGDGSYSVHLHVA